MIVLTVTAAGCSGSHEGDATNNGGGASGDELAGEIRVSAAASLTDAFTQIEQLFEQQHPRTDVVLNLAGSSTLREQVIGGAPVDVLASASTSIMTQLIDAGLVAGEPMTFARNRMQIAVPTGNPGEVTGLESFADESLFIGLCAEGVPCGSLGRQVLDAAGVQPAVDTNEPDVRALVTKIAAGELDAGLVYISDVIAAGDAIMGIGVSDDVNASSEYPIAVLADAPNPDGARAFVELVVSSEGQQVLAEWGFVTS